MDIEDGPTIVLYYLKDCGHCNALRPTWDEVKQMTTYVCLEIEKEDITKLPEHLQITIFPTIAIVRNGKIVTEYFGNRTKESIQTFIQSVQSI